MNNKYISLIISLALIVALMIGCYSVPAHSEAFAITAGAMGLAGGLAALASQLFGLDYSYNNVGSYTLSDVFVGSIPSDFSLFSLDVVNNPLGFTRFIVNSAFSQWLLDNDRDFVTDNQIVSDTTGNLYNYSGSSFHGVEFPYSYSNEVISPILCTIPVSGPGTYVLSGAGFTVNIVSTSRTNTNFTFSYNGTPFKTVSGGSIPVYPCNLHLRLGHTNNNVVRCQVWANNQAYPIYDYPSGQYAMSDTSSNLDYSVGTLDTSVGSVVSPNQSIYIDLDQQYTLEDLEEALTLLNELIVSGQGIDNIVLSDSPPVPPQPVDTPLGEVPYEDFLDTFGQSIYGKLDSISDGIDTVGQIIDGAGTDVIEAVDTAGQSVVEELEVIGGAIDTAGQSVVDSVEESTGILEEAIEAVETKVDELVDSIAEVIEEIMTHPLDLFSAWLDRLPEIPAIKDIFDGIKRHVGIWHYVVEWLGCIGTFLAFFIGLFGDVAYCMVVPIYACVAGAICLAFYKRFAR